MNKLHRHIEDLGQRLSARAAPAAPPPPAITLQAWTVNHRHALEVHRASLARRFVLAQATLRQLVVQARREHCGDDAFVEVFNRKLQHYEERGHTLVGCLVAELHELNALCIVEEVDVEQVHAAFAPLRHRCDPDGLIDDRIGLLTQVAAQADAAIAQTLETIGSAVVHDMPDPDVDGDDDDRPTLVLLDDDEDEPAPAVVAAPVATATVAKAPTATATAAPMLQNALHYEAVDRKALSERFVFQRDVLVGRYELTLRTYYALVEQAREHVRRCDHKLRLAVTWNRLVRWKVRQRHWLVRCLLRDVRAMNALCVVEEVETIVIRRAFALVEQSCDVEQVLVRRGEALRAHLAAVKKTLDTSFVLSRSPPPAQRPPRPPREPQTARRGAAAKTRAATQTQTRAG